MKSVLYFCLVLSLGFNLGKIYILHSDYEPQFEAGYLKAVMDIRTGELRILDNENAIIYPNCPDSIITIPIKLQRGSRNEKQ